ncbi:MAG TPA: type II toxin-antitoxin system prevent-host-death family antitoxin [Longimicrobiales bacterium]|nr:type II toxin-antitoxin system prevent-host-death family antitoxin [Longimicrobiales bacterium]
MRVVGIRELKTKLSEYLREVRTGEVFLVTDRDRVVAELRPPGSTVPPPPDSVSAALETLAAAGEVQSARSAKGEWAWSPRGAGLPPGTAESLMDELREERG